MADEFTKAALYWIKTFNKKVKEKIWMEKLINLLNEFETPQSWVVFKSYDDYDGTFYWVDIDGETEIAWSDSMILSKRFQWVKWLVENDKIDRTDIPTWFDYEYQWRKDIYCVSYEVNILTMRLSISDTPIEDLISYLR